MKMGDGVEWTLHCATVLAALPPGAVLSGQALAAFHGVSESYLLKHLKAMTAAGLFVSVFGPKGGYRLARSPADITLLDVVLAVEGDEPAFRCTEIRQCGPVTAPASEYGAPCAIHAAMQQAELQWRQSLASTSLRDIIDRFAAHDLGRNEAQGKNGFKQMSDRDVCLTVIEGGRSWLFLSRAPVAFWVAR